MISFLYLKILKNYSERKKMMFSLNLLQIQQLIKKEMNNFYRNTSSGICLQFFIR